MEIEKEFYVKLKDTTEDVFLSVEEMSDWIKTNNIKKEDVLEVEEVTHEKWSEAVMAEILK